MGKPLERRLLKTLVGTAGGEGLDLEEHKDKEKLRATIQQLVQLTRVGGFPMLLLPEGPELRMVAQAAKQGRWVPEKVLTVPDPAGEWGERSFAESLLGLLKGGVAGLLQWR